MKKLVVSARDDRLHIVLDFVRIELEGDISLKLLTQIELGVEEIFVNICHYAFPGVGLEDEMRNIRIICDYSVDGHIFSISFVDRGIPYNPLERKDPDITLSAQERLIGGLGIFMTKKLMDDMKYQFNDGCNVLTIKKNIG